MSIARYDIAELGTDLEVSNKFQVISWRR